MWKKRGIVTLALALLLALAPATPQAGTETATPDSAGKALKYIACAGAIVFAVPVPGSIFYAVLVCAHAFLPTEP
jgi:hypothetical protein